jgi:hypothetical protein
MQRGLFVAFLLACAGCSSGERCDVETYDRGCDGKRAWSYCADKKYSGLKKLWPTVVRMECQAHTECVEEGELVTCVAEPAQRCDMPDAERCVNGLSQRCWELRKGAEGSGMYYWFFVGLSCEDAAPRPE